jgi:hypothetical protein
MRLVLLLAVALLAVTSAGSAAVRAKPAHFELTLDTSGARAVLAAATADPAHAAEAADAALKNPAVLAMIAKMATYDRTVTPDLFRKAVVDAANGRSAKPFDLERLRKDPQATVRMLDRLETERDAIAGRMAERLQSFTPDGYVVKGKLIILVGSNQNGWDPDPKIPNFYVDLGFHGEEVDSLTNVAVHELFHVVQGMARDWDPELNDRPDLAPESRELHRAHALLLNLMLEGMASYVGDAALLPPSGPHIQRAQRDIARNYARRRDVFALFDTVVYRARHDPDAPFESLFRLSFGGAWDEPDYYAGYLMSKVIDRYSGRDRLRALVTLPPEEFAAEYIAIAKAHPGDPDVVALAPETVAVVEELRRLGERRP